MKTTNLERLRGQLMCQKATGLAAVWPRCPASSPSEIGVYRAARISVYPIGYPTRTASTSQVGETLIALCKGSPDVHASQSISKATRTSPPPPGLRSVPEWLAALAGGSSPPASNFCMMLSCGVAPRSFAYAVNVGGAIAIFGLSTVAAFAQVVVAEMTAGLSIRREDRSRERRTW